MQGERIIPEFTFISLLARSPPIVKKVLGWVTWLLGQKRIAMMLNMPLPTDNQQLL